MCFSCFHKKSKNQSNVSTFNFSPHSFLRLNGISKGTIKRVIDGDTYDIQVQCIIHPSKKIALINMRLRLFGTDAPETRLVSDIPIDYRENTKFAGLLIKKYVCKLIENKEFQFIFTNSNPNDKYGRLLIDIAFPSLNIPSLSNHLLSLGYVKQYSGSTKTWNKDEIDFIINSLNSP
jgi:endonuclease YncB( thermonuclease family)